MKIEHEKDKAFVFFYYFLVPTRIFLYIPAKLSLMPRLTLQKLLDTPEHSSSLKYNNKNGYGVSTEISSKYGRNIAEKNGIS